MKICVKSMVAKKTIEQNGLNIINNSGKTPMEKWRENTDGKRESDTERNGERDYDGKRG